MTKINDYRLPQIKKNKGIVYAPKIDIYDLTDELLSELEKNNLKDRLKEIPQLGSIKVKRKNERTRYDYIMTQLYLHQIIRNGMKNKLPYAYNNKIRRNEFLLPEIADYDKEVTIGDIIQLLTVISNIGHFRNTFTSSQAVVIASINDNNFYNMIIEASDDMRYKKMAKYIFDEKDYYNLHLINAFLLLERCDQSLRSIALCKEIIFSYIFQLSLEDGSKLKQVFKLFKKVRMVAYVASDLELTKMPIKIDLLDKESVLVLFEQLMGRYKDTMVANSLINSISKILDKTFYHKSSDEICNQRKVKIMVKKLLNLLKDSNCDYVNDFILSNELELNKQIKSRCDFDTSNILKIYFSKDEEKSAFELIKRLEKLNNVRVAWYFTHNDTMRVLVSLRKNCPKSKKITISLKIIKIFISNLVLLNPNELSDDRYLLCVKFFLYYLFNEREVDIIKPLNNSRCVHCIRGSRKKVSYINSLIKEMSDKDKKHEIEFLNSRLKEDKTNDTSVIVTTDIVVNSLDDDKKNVAEFDGLIIHIKRGKGEIVFLESKNRNKKKSNASKCLIERFEKLKIVFNKDEIKTVGRDAYYLYKL